MKRIREVRIFVLFVIYFPMLFFYQFNSLPTNSGENLYFWCINTLIINSGVHHLKTATSNYITHIQEVAINTNDFLFVDAARFNILRIKRKFLYTVVIDSEKY